MRARDGLGVHQRLRARGKVAVQQRAARILLALALLEPLARLVGEAGSGCLQPRLLLIVARALEARAAAASATPACAAATRASPSAATTAAFAQQRRSVPLLRHQLGLGAVAL